MIMETDPKFNTPGETIEYYKKLSDAYKKSLEDSQQELEEFQVGSRELEAELEAQLEQSEAKIRELKLANTQLQTENNRLQTKLNECQCETSHTIISLQDELRQLKLVREDLRIYIRKLEQKNDDLERAMRASVSSLEDFEGRLNQAIERNAFLENELDEKENMAVLIQRLKDETRDLRQELTVHDLPKTDSNSTSPVRTPEKVIDSNKLETENSPRYRLKKSFTHPNGIINPSTTTNVPYSALNIVGDLLKKVGVLESKLQSCRDCIKDTPDQLSEKRNTTNKLTSPKITFQSREAHEWIVTIHSKGLHPINSLNKKVFINQK